MEITQEKIEQAFEGTRFGENPNYRQIIVDTLLKVSIGFSTGHTAICVCRELGLLTKKDKPNSNGFAFMRNNWKLIKNID